MERLYKFTLTNSRGESLTFYGQGATLRQAQAEGLENCNSTFRPKQDGRKGKPGEINGLTQIAVRRADGSLTLTTLKKFQTK